MKKKRVVSSANGSPQESSREAALLKLRSTPSAPFKLKEEEIERSLRTGENADLLKRYFGERQYVELQEMVRTASTRSVRGGPRVLVLPGIMGSTLGAPRPFLFDDTIWLDPGDIAAGNLLQLKLPDAKNRPLGVILFSYMKIKMSLRLAGYNADFHPYDWRRSLDVLGPELAARLAKEGPDVSLVAHSMGGLVARAAIAAGAKNIKNVIQLGTPNYGSFVAVQALRAIYPVIRKIALLDLKHSPEELTERVFSTFPGLCQLLPSVERFTSFNVYDSTKWPAGRCGPRQDLLDQSKSRQQFMAPGDNRFVLIAGINQETVTSVGSDGTQFTYTVTNEGDGTVPLALAQLPEVRATYYVEEGHGSLPNNSKVIQAVKDLLSLGTTDALPTTWSPQRAVSRVLTEDDVRAQVPDDASAVRGASASDKEVRNILEELAAPGGEEELVMAPVNRVESVDGLVVSRQLQRRLDIRLALGDITQSSSKAYVLGIFSDVTPTGAAEAVDQQLDGAIGEFMQRRMFSANVGEVFAVPTSCSLLRSDTVLLAGLGSFDRFTPETLEVVAENVVRTFVKTHVDEFATVLIGSSSGGSVEGSLERLLKGFVRGLIDADKGKNFRRVTICEMDPTRFALVREELYRLASSDLFDDIQVAFEEERLPVVRVERVSERGMGSTAPDPVYLLVRQETTPDGLIEIQTSVLSAGAKAAVVTARKRPKKEDLDSLFDALASPSLAKNIQKFGAQLTTTLVHNDVASILKTMKGRPLIIVNDLLASRYPWEAMRLDGWAPALEGGIVRRYLAENLSVAKWLEARQEAAVLKMLLVVNPTKDLDGAKQEGARIKVTFGSHPGVQITERFEDQATRAALLKDFSSGQFDVIHYAGHAFFDPANPSRSGILCAGHQVLSGADIAGVGRLPNLIVFNACESGRLRTAQVKGGTKLLNLGQQIQRSVGMAEAFLRGGAANYLGTYWPVGDDSAFKFAEVFFENVLNGKDLGESILAGRRAIADFSVDWADYIFYGSPEFVLKKKKQ